MRLYLDANTIIYSVEGVPQFRDSVLRWIEQGLADGPLLTSELSRLECRVKPLREEDQNLLASYDAFFASPSIAVRPVDTDVVDRATEIRALHGFRTPDAIHLATAAVGGADTFLTGDAALARFSEIKVVVLSAPELSTDV